MGSGSGSRSRSCSSSSSSSIHGAYDVVVVGGGIMGSCIAYHLAKRACAVLLLEQFHFLHRRGSSHGESRTIRLTYPQDYYTAMALEALRLWRHAELEAGYRVLTPAPHLDLGPASDASLLSALASCRRHTVPARVSRGRDAALSGFPALAGLPEGWIAVETGGSGGGGVLHASKAVAMFQHLAARSGAALRDRTAVTAVSPGWRLPGGKHGVLVVTSNGAAIGRRCILATGAWTRALAMEISGIELPVQALQTSVAYWEIEKPHSDAFSAANGFPTFASYGDPYIYGTPSIEYPGLIKISLHAGYACCTGNRSFVPDLDALKRHVGPWIARFFTGKIKAEAPILVDSCMYSMTPDEDYILDFLPLKGGGESPILVAAGFSGHGFKMGPVVGRVMADLALTGAADGVPLERFSISRFLTGERGEFKEQVSLYDKAE